MSDKMREAFEAIESGGGEWNKAIERDSSGNYRLLQTAAAWLVWKDAWGAALAVQAQQPKAEPTTEAVQLARKILRNLGFALEPSSEPGVDERVDRIAALITAPPAPAAPKGYSLISNETLAEMYKQISGKPHHASDCSTSNAPALTPGFCDCDLPAPAVPDVEALAQFIRVTDGNHNMSAAALAEAICKWLVAAAPEPK